MRAAETWRDRCAHSPECATESDCLNTDNAKPRASSDNSAATEQHEMPTPKKTTPKHDPALEAERAQVKSLREQLDHMIEERLSTERTQRAEGFETKKRALDAETFEHLAGTLVLLDKLGASPAVDVIRTATLGELTAHAKRVTAKRVAPAPEASPS